MHEHFAEQPKKHAEAIRTRQWKPNGGRPHQVAVPDHLGQRANAQSGDQQQDRHLLEQEAQGRGVGA
ncbi:hypothetical protein D3C85_1717910 [compost metagenome]